VKCQDDRLYRFGLQSPYRGPNFIIIIKKDTKERAYEEDFLKYLFQLKPSNFKRSPAMEKKFTELIQKEEKQVSLQTVKILPPAR